MNYAGKTETCLKEIIDRLHWMRDEKFGNAGEMRNLVDAIERKRATRLIDQSSDEDPAILIEDIPEKYRNFKAISVPPTPMVFNELEDLIGLQSI